MRNGSVISFYVEKPRGGASLRGSASNGCDEEKKDFHLNKGNEKIEGKSCRKGWQEHRFYGVFGRKIWIKKTWNRIFISSFRRYFASKKFGFNSSDLQKDFPKNLFFLLLYTHKNKHFPGFLKHIFISRFYMKEEICIISWSSSRIYS